MDTLTHATNVYIQNTTFLFTFDKIQYVLDPTIQYFCCISGDMNHGIHAETEMSVMIVVGVVALLIGALIGVLIRHLLGKSNCLSVKWSPCHMCIVHSSVQNVTMVVEKFSSLHQYPRYHNKHGTTLFSIPSSFI